MLQPRSVTLVQLVCAALGIPAAIAGSYSAYQTYFSNEAVCQRLRTAVVATMERKLPLDAKQALLRKDVADFDKNCGDGDPDARTVFQTAMQERPPAPKARMQLAAADTQLPSAAPARPAAPPVFGTAGAGERSGWIALSRREAGALVSNFDSAAISETSLLPLGTVLNARQQRRFRDGGAVEVADQGAGLAAAKRDPAGAFAGSCGAEHRRRRSRARGGRRDARR